MINYIKNAKQCFIDRNIKINHIRFWNDGTVLISARTFHDVPDIKNSNTFYISLNYFKRLKRDHYPYFGIPKAKKYN
jgi:hypothetical protein